MYLNSLLTSFTFLPYFYQAINLKELIEFQAAHWNFHVFEWKYLQIFAMSYNWFKIVLDRSKNFELEKNTFLMFKEQSSGLPCYFWGPRMSKNKTKTFEGVWCKKNNNRFEVASIFSLICSLRLWKNFHSTQCCIVWRQCEINYSLFSSLIVFFSSLMPIEKMGDVENSEIPCTPWTTRMPKYAQPNLNYIGKKKKSNFSCMLLNPNIFYQIEF